MKEENHNHNSNRGILFFFLITMTILTLVNCFELLTRSDAEGRYEGLDHLDTLEDDAIEMWGAIQYWMGKQIAFGTTTYEDVTLLSNGYATMTDSNSDYHAAILGAEQASALAADLGAAFLYVQAPGKQRYADELPQGVMCYSVQKSELVVEILQQKQIPVIDMRSVLEATGEDWWNYFYRSDHHWNNQAAFIAYQQICEYLQSCGMQMNGSYLQPEAYERNVYQDVFLGTHGRMAGRYYTGLDDYELWLPTFDTQFDLTVASQGIHLRGDFEECFVHYENLDHYSFDYYAYYAYLKEDYDCFEIVNESNTSGPHVVIIRDSEAVPVSVFLACQCSELDIIDLRYCGDMEVSAYIREQQPDAIIYLFGPGYLASENAMVIPR